MHVLAITLSLIWMLLFWRFTRGFRLHLPVYLVAAFACCIAVVISQSDLWKAVYNGYPQDGFFDLTLTGRAGVLAISTSCIAIFFLLLAAKTRWILARTSPNLTARIFSLIADCTISLALFGFLFSLTPQLYYTLYQFVFPGLPNQIVIKSVFHLEKLHLIATLAEDDNLSHHLSGIVLLAVIPFTTWLHGMHRSWRKESILLSIIAVLTLQYASIF